MAAVQMKHIFFTGDRTLYFYFGEAKVLEGIAYIPHDNIDWISRAYIMGYRLDPETGEEWLMHRFRDRNITDVPNVAAESDSPAVDAEDTYDGHVLTADCACGPTVEHVAPDTDISASTDAQNAESVEEDTDEGAFGRGLTLGEDGLRESELGSDEGIPDGGLDGSGGDGPTVDGEGD